MELPTASHHQRVNVLGLLKRHTDLVPSRVEGKVDTASIVGCFHQLSQQITKKTYVLLDNAPVHRAQELIEQLPKWVKKGLIIKYLPAYAPELHLLEIWWRCMTYSWLPVSAYASFQCFVEASEEILTRFGTAYTISFQAA
jgi:hypothetical protein